MLKTEVIGNCTHNYSDSHMKIRQIETNILYDDAMDITPCPYTYEETDIPVEADPTNDAEGLLDIIIGGGSI